MKLGIDVGSTTTTAAYLDGNTASMIEINALGATMLPSVVRIADVP